MPLEICVQYTPLAHTHSLIHHIHAHSNFPRISPISAGTLIATPDESLYRTMRREGKKSIHRERILAYSTVGTPDYIAPEVLSQKVRTCGVFMSVCVCLCVFIDFALTRYCR